MNLGSPTRRFAGWGLVQQKVQPSSAADKRISFRGNHRLLAYKKGFPQQLDNVVRCLKASKAAKFTRMKSWVWGIPFVGKA